MYALLKFIYKTNNFAFKSYIESGGCGVLD